MLTPNPKYFISKIEEWQNRNKELILNPTNSRDFKGVEIDSFK